MKLCRIYGDMSQSPGTPMQCEVRLPTKVIVASPCFRSKRHHLQHAFEIDITKFLQQQNDTEYSNKEIPQTCNIL
jgi:hypothetical protein